MKTSINNYVLSSAAAFSLFAISANIASAGVIFDNLPNPAPGNVDSYGYEAISTSAMGSGVTFAGTDRDLTSVTVGLSDWAKQSDFPSMTDATGWDHPVTVNVYASGAGGAVGSLIATKTQTVHVPWYVPNADFHGLYFTTSFDFTGTTVPDSAIFSVAFNTEHYGASPIAASGPFNSLNYGVTDAAPSFGSYINADNAYWDATYGGRTPGLAMDAGGWASSMPLVQVVAVPEPTSIALLGLGAAALLRRRRRTV